MSYENRDRITIYSKQPERRALLDWVRRYTKADSDSEAIFEGLRMLKEKEIDAKKRRSKRLISSTKGSWKRDAVIEDAFTDVAEGWHDWDQDLSS